MKTKKELTKVQQLKLQLRDSLHEEITVNTGLNGIKTFTIGDFLDNQIVCAKTKSSMPLWHADQLVYPVMQSLIKLVAEEKREREEPFRDSANKAEFMT